jgi:hypothetical protein
VTCTPRPGITPLNGNGQAGADTRPPRSADDYGISVDEAGLPAGVTMERWIDWQ